jgi:hypothetical protein
MGSIFGEIRRTVAELWASASAARGGELIYFIVWGVVEKAFAGICYSTIFYAISTGIGQSHSKVLTKS